VKRTFENLILEPANAAHITAPKKRKKGKKEKRKKGNSNTHGATHTGCRQGAEASYSAAS